MNSFHQYLPTTDIACDSKSYIDSSNRTNKIFHYHPHYEMTIVTNGQKYYFNNSTHGYLCKKGQIVIHSPYTFHANCPANSESFSRINLYILPQMLENITVPHSEDSGMTVITPPKDVFDTCVLLAERIESHLSNQNYCKTILGALFGELRFNIRSEDVVFSRSDSVYVVEVFKYIEENLDSQLTREELAQKFHISVNKLSNDFKRFTSLSLHQYVMRYKIMRSTTMLNSGMSVQQTALACGFYDESHYISVFKRFMDITPERFVSSGTYKHNRLQNRKSDRG